MNATMLSEGAGMAAGKKADAGEQPEKMDLRSADIAAERQAELLRLFPEVRTEGGKIDFERLQRALGEMVDAGRERYGLTWPGKADCFRTIQAPSLGTLRPARDESVNFDTSENLIIEGDNLEVLKLLQKSYLGKVKMIYIDPPYNTGNDFIYPDNYGENLKTYLQYTGQVDAEGRRFGTNTETDGRFHSKWLNMMYPRVYLGHNLLRDDGYLIASIDDDEFANAERVLDEVFGEENRIAVLVFDRNRKNDAKFFSVGHEYMIVYAKNKALLRDQGVELRAPKEGIDDVRAEFDRLAVQHGRDWSLVASGLRDYYKTFAEDDPRKPLARFTKVDERGPYRDDGDISWPGGGGPRYEVKHPKTKRPCKVPVSGWRFPKLERMNEEIAKGRVAFGDDETTVPALRRNLFEATDQLMGSVTFSYAQKAAQEFNAIFDEEKVFDNPKNYNDLARLFAYLGSEDDVILDFFAGSGTTGHAVLELNRRDGGRRRFIQVQLPEPTRSQSKDGDWIETTAWRRGLRSIADITKERVRRVIKKFDAEDAGKLDLDGKDKQDRGFRVFKLDQSNFLGWDGSQAKDGDTLGDLLERTVDHVRQGRTDDDLLYELLLKSGFPLTTKVEIKTIAGKTVHSISDGVMLVCLDRALTLELIRAMADLKPERVVCLDAGFANNDQLKANAVLTFKSKGVVKFMTV